MYEILMDENRWKGFTQSNTKISKEVTGEFSIFVGSVTGTNVELQNGKLILQKWRFRAGLMESFLQSKLWGFFRLSLAVPTVTGSLVQEQPQARSVILEVLEELTKSVSFKPELQRLHLQAAFHESMGDLAFALQDCEAALCLDLGHMDILDL